MQELNNEFSFDPKSVHFLGMLWAAKPNFNIRTADWGEFECLRRRQHVDLEKEGGSVTHFVLHNDVDGGGGGGSDDDDDDDAQ